MMDARIRKFRKMLAEAPNYELWKAAALELDLVRLELMQGQPQEAAARLDAQRRTLIDNFPETSRYRRQLDCLDAGNTDPACWR